MKNIVLFPKLSRVRRYQIKCSFLLTTVPLLCLVILTVMLLNFAQMNLFFLENKGLLVGEEFRQAYFDQVQLEMGDVVWFIAALYFLTLGISYMLMGWAISPFVNGEKVLRQALNKSGELANENDWLSESPRFHNMIWGLAQRLTNDKYPFDNGIAKYEFNWRFFIKFIVSFFAVSIATGYVLGMMLSSVYTKIVSLAIELVHMRAEGHFFVAQENMLKSGVTFTVLLSSFTYILMGYYVTVYMSNMQFVFIRAVKEHHFPLELRNSDVYHSLASAVSDVAEKCGLSRKIKS
jgi:hypothetical protein